MNLPAVAVGAVAGALGAKAVDAAEDKKDQLTGNDTPDHGPVEMQMMVHILSEIHHLAKEMYGRLPLPIVELPIFIPGTLNFPQAPYNFNRRGYRHISVFTTGGVVLSVQAPQMPGTVTVNLGAGWNSVDIPDKSLLLCTSGGVTAQNGAITLLFRWSDDKVEWPGL